jgi:hypothetical protein
MALRHTLSHLNATHFTAPDIGRDSVSTPGAYLLVDLVSVDIQRLNGTRQGADSAEAAARAI